LLSYFPARIFFWLHTAHIFFKTNDIFIGHHQQVLHQFEQLMTASVSCGVSLWWQANICGKIYAPLRITNIKVMAKLLFSFHCCPISKKLNTTTMRLWGIIKGAINPGSSYGIVKASLYVYRKYRTGRMAVFERLIAEHSIFSWDTHPSAVFLTKAVFNYSVWLICCTEKNFGDKSFWRINSNSLCKKFQLLIVPFREWRSASLKASVCGMTFWKVLQMQIIFCNPIKGAIVHLSLRHPLCLHATLRECPSPK